ncbi:nucleoside monophosphate kinase, partial [Candidatus Peregrinibacteria bacterium]|nr:nucleoside monophosphate kinase [Candidatus Peregrinibacteria bacterium]
MDLILFGIQGSGKGTQGKILAERYGLKIFETGGALRALAQEDSELARKVKSIIEAGHLVPNEVVMEIVEDFMNKQEASSPILFDG